MSIRAAFIEVMLGVEARLKLVEIALALRTLGYETTGSLVDDVKRALADRFTAYDQGLQDGVSAVRKEGT